MWNEFWDERWVQWEPVNTYVEHYRYYADAVDWLLHRGITTGVGGNRFAPNDPVTRAQMATFLWRLAGSPV